MTLVGSVQNVTTTAAQLGLSLGSRTALIVRNPAGSGATIFVGGSNVTAANAAFVLAPDASPLIISSGDRDSLAAESWFARTSSGTATGVSVTEV